MPFHQRGEVTIYYETRGEGFPLLLIAPGGMRSTISWWGRSAFNPLEIFSRAGFWTIAMDQRNTGQSSGPLEMDDPWGSYAEDQLNLMNHLGIDQFHVLGCCIGCSFALSLAQRAPDRVVAAVLEQPIGIDDENRDVLPRNLYGQWAKDLVEKRTDIDLETAEAFGKKMCTGEFVISVTRDFVRGCSTPLLVMPGNNLDHPRATGMEIASIAPHAELIEEWRYPSDLVPPAVARIKTFLKANTPSQELAHV